MGIFILTQNTALDFGRGPFHTPQVGVFQFLTDTVDNMKLPVNCVIAGQQKEPVKKAMGLSGVISGPLKGIFNE